MTKTLKIKSGEREFEFEMNDWAERAHSSVVVRSGDSLVLTTIVKGGKREGIDFTPLTVDYEEKYSAAGKMFGSRFMKREGRPSETAVLNGRLIDRSIRPALAGVTNELQIVNTIFSIDPENDTDIMALLGSAIVVDLLGIEWSGPIVGVKIAKIGAQFVVNPKNDALADFTMFVSGNKNKINMIELSGNEVAESDIVKACELAQKELENISKAISGFTSQFVTNREKLSAQKDLIESAEKFLKDEKFDLEKILFSKKEGDENLSSVFKRLQELKNELGEDYSNIYQGLEQKLKAIFKKKIFDEKIRPDGRKLDEVRPLKAAVGILPRPHGSAIFQRGLTHIMSSVTLAPPGEELWVREIEYEGLKRVMHHYNFPPYSTGEVKRMGSPGRREIGHGALAEKSIAKIIPDEEKFPYTVRLVSDVLCSNGSTSMGSVCASSLALLDAGVPIEKIVTGISIGLVYENDDKYLLLTDIQGPEDHYGCMDFKVASTPKGVVAIQLDVKFEGLTTKMVKEAIESAIIANKHTADFIKTIISEPRKSFKKGVPYVSSMTVDPDKIGAIIGPGGRVIQEITALTNTKIDVKQDGTVFVSSEIRENLEKAKNWIKIIGGDLNEGDIIQGKVVKILDFGALVELAPDKSGLLHISEISNERIERVEDKIHLGDTLSVTIKQLHPDGKISLTLKNAGHRS